jgi:3-oxoacyl-[acyl-carrier protein] reductase
MREKVLLITGASSDLGIALVRELVGSEWSHDGVIIAHVHSGTDRIVELARELPQLGARLRVLRADFAVDADVSSFVERVKSEYGCPTHLVHLSAPALRLVKIPQVNWDACARELKIQVGSLSAMLAAFLPVMGRLPVCAKVVVMLSSVTLGVPPKYMSEYVTAKYALLGMFRAAAAEYADKPICINAVSPSMIETRFLEQLPPKLIEMVGASNPARRNATPADVVPLVRFLLSPQSDYLRGVNVPVTAGSFV